jgi:lysophospholipase L1-like esterase
MKPKSVQKSLILSLLVLGMLGVLSVIPAFHIGDYRFRRIDLFSGVKRDKQEKNVPLETDERTPVTAAQPDEATKDTVQIRKGNGCKPGLTCLEDFTKDKSGIKKFLRALSQIDKAKKPVRIAFYGDSFIEGDVFCGGVRDTLQSVFGGRGVGFVPITSRITGFRNTIRHAFENWDTHSIVSPKDSMAKIEMGPAGYCFQPMEDNWVEFRVSKQRFLRDFAIMKLYYKNQGTGNINYTINDSIFGIDPLEKSPRLREWKLESRNAKVVEFEFENPDSLQVFGASFEDRHGVYVDNFAMRGNSGIGLAQISDEMFRAFNKYRDYKLIILQYGLNVVNNDSARYKWYADRMVIVIEKIKKAFPSASIVLVSVSDRSTNIDGNYKTDESIPALRNIQREIARRTEITFWDMYSAMGGKDSMVKYVSSRPALAAKDYTHLTFTGGRRLAGHLVRSLLFEFDKYTNKEQNQKP